MHQSPRKLALSLALVATCMVSACSATAVEEPNYQVLKSIEALQIRAYPPLLIAQVQTQGDQKQAASAGFKILADYIFGNNRVSEKIEMTAPVSQKPSSEEIAMTAPVSQTRNGESWLVRFSIPEKYTLKTVPKPNDARVELLEIPARKMAVLRFSGRAEPELVQQKMAALQLLVKDGGFIADGEPILAQYNPPWTPSFMRRNEVMLTVRENK